MAKATLRRRIAVRNGLHRRSRQVGKDCCCGQEKQPKLQLTMATVCRVWNTYEERQDFLETDIPTQIWCG